MAQNHQSSTQFEELTLLREAIKRLGKSADPAPLIREQLHLLSELLGLNRGRVVLPEADGTTLSIRYAYGMTAREIERGRYRRGEGVTGRVMSTGAPQVVQDAAADPSFLARAVDRNVLQREGSSFIAVPIKGARGVAGVLAVHRLRGRGRPFADDMAVLQTVATLIGQLLQLQRVHAEAAADAAGRVPGMKDNGRVYQRVAVGDRERVQKALAQSGGNMSRAAQRLGLTLRQFTYRMKVLGLK